MNPLAFLPFLSFLFLTLVLPSLLPTSFSTSIPLSVQYPYGIHAKSSILTSLQMLFERGKGKSRVEGTTTQSTSLEELPEPPQLEE